MTISANYAGGIQRPMPVRLTTTSLTDIVTGVDNTATVGSWSLANETAGAVVTDCYYHDGTTDFLVFSRSVPANDTVIVSDVPLRLYSGDKFKVQAATGNAITVTPVIVTNYANEPTR